MADQQPPKSSGDETEVLLTALRFQRESFLRKVEGLTDDEARRPMVPSGMTLLWLTKHLAFAEQIWLRQRVAGEVVELDNEVRDGDTVASAIAGYRAVWPMADAIIAGHDLDAEVADPHGQDDPLNVRWVVVHLIEEVARHAGHADVLRELIDGQTGR